MESVHEAQTAADAKSRWWRHKASLRSEKCFAGTDVVVKKEQDCPNASFKYEGKFTRDLSRCKGLLGCQNCLARRSRPLTSTIYTFHASLNSILVQLLF